MENYQQPMFCMLIELDPLFVYKNPTYNYLRACRWLNILRLGILHLLYLGTKEPNSHCPKLNAQLTNDRGLGHSLERSLKAERSTGNERDSFEKTNCNFVFNLRINHRCGGQWTWWEGVGEG